MYCLRAKDEKVQQKIYSLTRHQRQLREVYAVALGSTVSYSSHCGSEYTHYQLDYTANKANGWCPQESKLGEWIQVQCESPKYWTDIIMQGRGDADQWVTSIKVATSINGKVWENVEKGKIYQTSSDRNTRVRITFSSAVYGRALRIYPQTWHKDISMRFQAIYIDLE